MAKRKKKQNPPSELRNVTAQAGIGALLIGVVAALTGGFTKENAIEWGKAIIVAVSIALMIRWPLFEPYRIPSDSMAPTLEGDPRIARGDRVFVNKWWYGVRYPFANKRIFHLHEPERWDIVVFKTVEEDTKIKTLVKRVVGLPGERVQIENGVVHVNGEPVQPPGDWKYTSDPQYGQYYGVLPSDEYSVVPEGHYLLLGDNSPHSRDGRVWGWVPNEHLVGRVFCIAWPPTRWRDFTGFSETWWWRTFVPVYLTILGLYLITRLFFGRFWKVRTGALSRAFKRGERVFVNRAVFGFPIPFSQRRMSAGEPPARGDIVMFRAPADNGAADKKRLLLGRVAGLPGEEVSLDGDRLAVNGQAVERPHSLAEPFPGDGVGLYGRSRTKQYSLVPPDHFFILVDDAAEQPDSRAIGWVSREDLVGRVSAVTWPPHRWRRVKR